MLCQGKTFVDFPGVLFLIISSECNFLDPESNKIWLWWISYLASRYFVFCYSFSKMRFWLEMAKKCTFGTSNMWTMKMEERWNGGMLRNNKAKNITIWFFSLFRKYFYVVWWSCMSHKQILWIQTYVCWTCVDVFSIQTKL